MQVSKESKEIQEQMRNKIVDIKFDNQINYFVSASFFQLRGLRKLKFLLYFGDLETVIHAFVSTMLDYSNTLYAGVKQLSFSRLKLVQNDAGRFLMGRRRGSISPLF